MFHARCCPSKSLIRSVEDGDFVAGLVLSECSMSAVDGGSGSVSESTIFSLMLEAEMRRRVFCYADVVRLKDL